MVRLLSRSILLALFSFALLDCASAYTGTPESAPLPPSTTCPAPGSRVPYAQLLAQTRQFHGCLIETEVAYMAAGAGGVAVGGGSLARAGESVFRIQPPGQTAQGGPLGIEYSYLIVPDATATPLYSASGGSRFLVRGRMELRIMRTIAAEYDLGNTSRFLHAMTIQPAP